MKYFFSFFAAIVMTFCCAVCANAQSVPSTWKIEQVKKLGVSKDGQHFYVLSDSSKLEISDIHWRLVRENKSAYSIVDVGGLKTLFANENLATPSETYVFEAQKASLDAEKDQAIVTMTNGYYFSDNDVRWLGIQPGQHVQILRWLGMQQEVTVFSTVPRDKELKGTAEAASKQLNSDLQQRLAAAQSAKLVAQR